MPIIGTFGWKANNDSHNLSNPMTARQQRNPIAMPTIGTFGWKVNNDSHKEVLA
jgi:hypothetical protein